VDEGRDARAAEAETFERIPREEPARYNRSPKGLLVALLVTVLAVVAFVLFRATFRDQPERAGELAEYRTTVEAAQEAGIRLVNLRDIPDGWEISSVEYAAGPRPSWAVNLLTDEGRFIGVFQSDVDDVAETLEDFGVDDPEPGDKSAFRTDLATRTWQTWAGTDAELGYSTTLTEGDPSTKGGTVLVYGPAGRADQEKLISLLTADDLD
jgi:hypothetical protein